MVPPEVGAYLHQHLAGSAFELLPATGHFPHFSAPQTTIDAVLRFLAGAPQAEPGVTRPDS